MMPVAGEKEKELEIRGRLLSSHSVCAAYFACFNLRAKGELLFAFPTFSGSLVRSSLLLAAWGSIDSNLTRHLSAIRKKTGARGVGSEGRCFGR